MAQQKKIENFKMLCKKEQYDLKDYLFDYLTDLGRDVIYGEGFLYSDTYKSAPILLCAHMDTVHAELPKVINVKKGKISSPQGIGGDDRCGIYMILEILKSVDVRVCFFEDEEFGGIGSKQFARTKLCRDLEDKVNFVIELDRKGSKDAVYYDCGNKEFMAFIEEEFFERAIGSFTDICNICPAMNRSGVNLSCGYYLQHTKEEYVVFAEMEKAIQETIKLIKRGIQQNVPYEWVESDLLWNDWGYGLGGYRTSYSSDLQSYYDKPTTATSVWVIMTVDKYWEYEAVSMDEAVGKFLIDNPEMRYCDIFDVYVDNYTY